MPEYDFVCRNCREDFELDELEEVEGEKRGFSEFVCPECGGEDFIRIPKRIEWK